MQWTVPEIARALARRASRRGSTPWPGWPASRLILAPWFRGQLVRRHSADLTTMDINIVDAALQCRSARSGRRRKPPGRLQRFRSRQALRRSRHAGRRCKTWRARSAGLGPPHRRGHRVGGQDHHQRDSGGTAGREISRLEIRGQSEQRIRLAAGAAAARAGGRGRGGRAGHVASRRIAASGGDCRAGGRRGHAAWRRCIWSFSLPWTRSPWPSAS